MNTTAFYAQTLEHWYDIYSEPFSEFISNELLWNNKHMRVNDKPFDPKSRNNKTWKFHGITRT